jgi:hypothetical protein
MALRLQIFLITLNYNAIARLHPFSSPLHTHWDSLPSIVVSWQRIPTQKPTLQITIKVLLPFLVQSHWNLGTEVKLYFSLLLTPPSYDCPQTTFVFPYKPSARTYRIYVTWSLPTVVWPHCLRRSEFTEPLLRKGLHSIIVLLLYVCYLATAVLWISSSWME